MIIVRWLYVAAALTVYGCGSQVASLREYTQSCIGHPISELKASGTHPNINDSYKSAIGWKEASYQLENGDSVWTELAWKDCFIRWEVNPQGIIVNGRAEGRSCKWH